MFYRFRYEEAYDPPLSRLPLHLRMKLDLTGVKISLQDWLSFSLTERTVLCHLPIDTDDEAQAFVAFIDFLCRKYRGTPAATTDILSRLLWEDGAQLPGAVKEMNIRVARPITSEEWKNWNSYQRYALYKTAISRSEPEAFFAVLDELRGGESQPIKTHD